jgi:formamidopyrimidine-DNA glycosylase
VKSLLRPLLKETVPELPEVETTVRGLNKKVRGLQIVDVWTNYISPKYVGKDEIKNSSFFKKFKKEIVGATILKSTRRGKNILIHLDTEKTILIHLKMTGHLLFGEYRHTTKEEKSSSGDTWIAAEEGPLKDPFNRFIHFNLSFNNGMILCLSDVRKFAKVTLLPTDTLFESKALGKLGPEPLDNLSIKTFTENISIRSSGKIKSVLMDQTLVAGIGNIYSDEILWYSDINPERRVSTLSAKEFSNMYEAMKKLFKKSLTLGGDSESDFRNIDGIPGRFQKYHKAYRQSKKPCTKKGCRGTITRTVIGGRSAHFCDSHQS